MNKKPELAKAINDYLVSGQSHYIPKKLTFSPSKATSPCKRKVFYNYLRVQPDFKFNAKTMRIFDTGNSLHTLMKDWVRATYGLIDYRGPDGKIPIHWVTKLPDPEFPISFVVDEDGGTVKGKMDGVGIIDSKLWVYEFKSIKDFKYLTEPKPDHLQQAMSYVYALQNDLREGKHKHIKELDGFKDVEGVIFLYLNKTTSEIVDYVVPKAFEPFEAFLSTVHSTLSAVEQRALPSKTPDFCASCEFRIKCSKNYNPKA